MISSSFSIPRTFAKFRKKFLDFSEKKNSKEQLRVQTYKSYGRILSFMPKISKFLSLSQLCLSFFQITLQEWTQLHVWLQLWLLLLAFPIISELCCSPLRQKSSFAIWKAFSKWIKLLRILKKYFAKIASVLNYSNLAPKSPTEFVFSIRNGRFEEVVSSYWFL